MCFYFKNRTSCQISSRCNFKGQSLRHFRSGAPTRSTRTWVVIWDQFLIQQTRMVKQQWQWLMVNCILTHETAASSFHFLRIFYTNIVKYKYNKTKYYYTKNNWYIHCPLIVQYFSQNDRIQRLQARYDTVCYLCLIHTGLFLTFAIDSRVGRRGAAVTDVLAVKVVVRVPVQVLLVTAADKMAAWHYTFLDTTSAASFNTSITSFNNHSFPCRQHAVTLL